MKIKVSYIEYGNEIDILHEREVDIIESSMSVLHSRMNEPSPYVHLGDLILRSESIQKIEKLQ